MTTENEIHQWLAGYRRDWDQLCQALMWQLCNRFGSIASTPPSAIEAYQMERNAGRIVQGTPPAGTFVYWDIGSYGHVGFVMNDGRVLMATSHLAAEWVDTDAGWNTLDAYSAATGATYLGYSWRNGGNVCPFTADAGTSGGGSSPVPIDEETEMIVNIQGKSGVRNGGAYYIEAGVATFLGGNVDGVPTLTFDQGTALAKRVSGIGG